MKVLFLFPPQWTTDHPHYSLSLLAGQLKQAGHQVEVIDLNLELMEQILQPASASLSLSLAEIEREYLAREVKLRLATQSTGDAMALASAKLIELDKQQAQGRDEILEKSQGWSKAADTLRSPEGFYDPFRYMDAKDAIDNALHHFSLPYFPSEVRWNNFLHPTVPLNLEPMIEFCTDADLNPFLRFLTEQKDRILAREADIIAISIGSFSQLLPGLTIARLIHTDLRDAATRAAPGASTHLSLGGNFLTRLKNAIKSRPQFFHEFCDSVTIGEGEIPMVRLANALDGAGNEPHRLQDVPSLLYIDDAGEIQDTPEPAQTPMDSLAFMDLSPMPLNSYYSPDVVACLRASKGCYWGECTFCDSHYGLRPDVMAIDRLIEEMTFLGREFGVRNFEFVDQCIEPKYMTKMCEAIIKSDLDISWFCNGRTESGFTPELFELMKRAGATKVMWGVESASGRLLKLMRKGVSVETRLKILRMASDAGLWNFGYIFFGFPTETEEEAMLTMDLLEQNTDILHSYGRSVFSLGKHSPLMNEADKYGILSWTEDEQEFSMNLSHRVTSGLSEPEVMAMADRCTAVGRRAYADPLWMALRSRETLHLYVAKFGREFVEGFRFGGKERRSPDAEFVF